MTIFDYLVLFVMVCSVIISMLRGLIKEVLSLLGWVIALVVANAYGEALGTMLPDFLPGELTRLIVAFVVLFIGTRILVGLLASALEAVVKASGLTTVDRGLGALFGVARGLVIVLTAVLLCGMTAVPQQEFWKQAKFSSMAQEAALGVLPLLPGGFASHVHF
ncbi:MAG: CvpA family protein [Janthinobacterium lividum]